MRLIKLTSCLMELLERPTNLGHSEAGSSQLIVFLPGFGAGWIHSIDCFKKLKNTLTKLTVQPISPSDKGVVQARDIVKSEFYRQN